MVAIVSGNSLGLNLTSLATLGRQGVWGSPAEGRNGQSAYVNVGNGNLVLQSHDDHLAARGLDAAVLRTYNSQGLRNDDNADQWSSGAWLQPIVLTGTLDSAGSTLARTDRDGSVATFTFDTAASRYVSSDGAGAHETITHVAAPNQLEWRDGSTGVVERYEAGGACRLLSSRDPNGNALSYGYDTAGRLASVATANGETISYSYLASNLAEVRTVTSAGASSTRVRYGYDASNRLERVTVDLSPEDSSVGDGKVYQTTYSYHGESNRVASVTQADGTSLAFTFVDVGGGTFKVETVRDGLNNLTTFAYGAGFSTVADATGKVTRFEIDPAGRLTSITPPSLAGAVNGPTRFSYAANGDLLSTTDGEGGTVAYEYDAGGNQILQRDQAGNTVTRTYSVANLLLTETVYAQPDPDGTGAAPPGVPLTTRYAYDSRNLLRFVVTAQGQVSEFRYNGFGEQVASIAYASAQYPVNGLAPSSGITEDQLVTWAAAQDRTATQRVDTTFDARGQVQTRTSYASVDAAGLGVADGTHSLERYVYDQAGRLLQTVSGTGGTNTYTYDGLGRMLSARNALDQVSLTRYDDPARKTIVTLANGLVTTSAYDVGGRLVSVVQSSGTVAFGETRYFHDANDRLRMTQDPTGVRHWVLYDEAGRKAADIDGTGTMTEYTYDRNDLVTRVSVWGGTVNTASLVDANGQPVLLSAAAVRPAATAADSFTWRAYDQAHRLVREARSVGTGATAAVTETRYDGASRVVEVIRYASVVPADGSAGAVSAGSVPQPGVSGQDRVTRNFHDADGRLSGKLDAEGYLTLFSYNTVGQLTGTVGYATRTDATLRATGTLAQLQPADSAADVRTITLYNGKGQVIAQVDGERYLTESVYDAAGNLTQSVRYAMKVAATATASSFLHSIRPAATASDRAASRTYDLLNRLKQETSPEGVVTNYTYDVGGKLASTERAAGTGEVRSLLAGFDLQGRLTRELSATGAALLTGGQTQAQVDAIWQQYGTTHSYDAASRRISSTNPAGARTLYYYNGDGALTHTVNALGEVRETRYDSIGRVSEEYVHEKRIAPSGLSGGLVPQSLTDAIALVALGTDLRVRYTYSSDGRVASTFDGQGNTTYRSYNAFGEEIRVDEQLGGGLTLTQTNSMDRRGLRTSAVKDPFNTHGLQTSTTTAYDAFGRAVREVDAQGNVREQEHDRLGRVVTTRDPRGAARSTSYDAFGGVLTQSDALGNTTLYAYDRAARTFKVTTPEGIVTTTTYTRHGQVQAVTDGRGQVTSFDYDENGQLRRTTAPLTVTSAGYDTSGRLTETTDAAGTKVRYAYDEASRVLTRRVDPDGLDLTTTYAYDGKGQQVSVTDPMGVVTTVKYDNKGQVLRQTIDPAGLNLQTVYTYNARGSVLTVTAPGGTVTEYVFDALGRRTQETVDPAGLKLKRNWEFDRNGNVTSATDGARNLTRHAYDVNDRLVFTVDPAGGITELSYDVESRVTRTVRYAAAVPQLVLDGLARAPTVAEIRALVRSDSAHDVVEHRVYDRGGRIVATVDGTGAVVRYSHDANGNVTTRTAHAARIDLSVWTPGSLPTPVIDTTRDARQETVYDALNRAIYTVNGIGAVVAKAYDGNGKVTQRTAYAAPIPTNTATTKEALDAAVAVAANSGRDQTARNSYDAAGRLSWSADGVGAVTQQVYDKNGNVVQHVAYAAPVALNASPSSVVGSSLDRITSMAYDAANRLVVEIDALKGLKQRVYDAAGNVVRQVAYAEPIQSIPVLGTLASAGAILALRVVSPQADRTVRHGYDAAGRVALTIDPTGSATKTEYDGAGQVIAVTSHGRLVDAGSLPDIPSLEGMKLLARPDPELDRVTRRAHDAAGRRVFDVDGAGAVKRTEYDGAGRVLRTILYAKTIGPLPTTAAAMDAAVEVSSANQVESRDYNAAGQLIASTDAIGGTESFTYDALGNKLTFRNKKGAVWQYAHDAAGRLTTETSPLAAMTSTSANPAGSILAGATADASVVTHLGYDALGNLTRRTEALGRAEERTTKYEYDALGRQVRVIFPPVAVYNAAADGITTNGATGIATRAESVVALDAQTFYDVFGNAVASRDVGGAISQKAHDLLGRVVYEVDALGYVTGQARNSFGEVTRLTRYGSGTTLASISVTKAADAVSKVQVDAVLAAASFSHANDRILVHEYDRAGRVVKTLEPTAYVYDAASGARGDAAKTTVRTYDAFGQLVQVQLARSGVGSWSTSTHYYDKAGRQQATIDTLGYLTWRRFDAAGNTAEVREYATARTAGSWNVAGYGAVLEPTGDDRSTTYIYDKLDRRTQETRVQVEFSSASDGTSTRGNLTTTFDYDAVGNQTVVTDAAGNRTHSHYDALGRVTAVAAPARSSTASGTTVIPLTVFRRDAHGNVAVKIEYANGAASATSSAPALASGDDRTTLSLYDSFSRATQTTDANGANEFSSYDGFGHVAKKWQGVTGNDDITRTRFELNIYDQLGQLVETRTPASTASLQATASGPAIVNLTQAQAGVVSTGMEYNAFGEMTRKGTQGGRQEYFDYDRAGRLWRTNSGEGVDRIRLYDVQGNLTSEIRSAGSGRDNVDVKAFADARAADASPSTRRVDIKLDALGRLTEKLEAARQDVQGGVSVQSPYISATVIHGPTATSTDYGTHLSGSYLVSLSWPNLASLGSGDVKVYMEYVTPLTTSALGSGVGSEPAGAVYTGGTLRSVSSGLFTSEAAATGASISWPESPYETDYGIAKITRIVVYKKDVSGTWRVAIDQAPGYGSNVIDVATPTDPGQGLKLEIRVAGSAGDTGWWAAPTERFGDLSRMDARGLTPGSYEYRVSVLPVNDPARVTATGNLTITQPPLNAITVPIGFGQAGSAVLAWAAPGAGVEQTLRYRLSGSNGGWSALAVRPRNAYALSGVDTTGLAAGTYQFELLWTRAGEGSPSSHATGAFTITAPVPDYWVPAVNLPNIGGLRIGSTNVGGSFSWYDENGNPLYVGGTTVPALVWNAANANVARYRVAGGAWNALAIDNLQQRMDQSGWTGVQVSALNGFAPGTYEVQILAGSPPSAQATCTLVVYAQGPGYYQTVYVQVASQQPVIASYQPIYETRYGSREVWYQVWVADPPVLIGYDEAGTPIYSYPSHQEWRSYWETYAYQVQVGTRPVYATDENGNIVYQTVWTTQAEQQWVAGTTPSPTITVTTPAYTPGYWVPGAPAQYSVSVTTAPGSVAISSTADKLIAQGAGLNGDARWLRPTVLQTLDRWGNVLEVTDPRSSYWKTTYRYNASNQVVLQSQPDVGGGAGVTRIYYDAMGRQVAVTDANANVNGQVFDAAGNLVADRYASGGVVRYAYDAFGQRTRTTDAEGRVVTFTYDKLGHVLSMARGVAAVYRVNASDNGLQYLDTRNISETWRYDQLGRKLKHTNGNGEVLGYTFDLRGNVIETWQPMGQVSRAAYDAQDRKAAEADANGRLATWTHDYFGVLGERSDLDRKTYRYSYDNAMQLVAQTSTRGQSITYSHDAAGQVTRIADATLGKVSTYAYDLSGRKIRERVVQGGAVYQDNHLAYDALGRLRDVADARAHVSMDYDKVGNRTRVLSSLTYQGVSGEAGGGSDRHFKYDQMNRQIVVDAIDAGGTLGTRGHQITYDGDGNRTSDLYWGNVVTAVVGQQGTLATYQKTMGYTKEVYRYDSLKRLEAVERDGLQIDLRVYDGADRVVQSGPVIARPMQYTNLLNEGLAPRQTNGHETRINRYDANGRLMHQRVLKSDHSLKADISWDPNENLGSATIPYIAAGYDAVGNVRGYVVRNHEDSFTNRYSTTTAAYDGYKAAVTSAESTKLQPGSTTQVYDVNGFLVGVDDATENDNDRNFVNDANGVALYVNQRGNVQRQLIVNGEVLGIYGVGVDPKDPISTYTNPNYANLVDFDFGYAPITAGYPSASPGAYQVRTGDTLRSIAQSALGDSSLWYRIAEANGLDGNEDLKVGQTVNIPNRVGTISNNSSTFKPYDPTRIEGDTMPSMAMPKEGCGGAGQLLMLIVAIVVTVYTAGAAAAAMSASTASGASAAVAAAAGGYMGVGTAVMTGAYGATGMAAAAIGAAAGGAASQLVGLATGTIDRFDWRGVALGAVSAGLTAGVGMLATPGSALAGIGHIGKSMLVNVATQGIAVATGLQHKFNWRGVAASGVGAAVGHAVAPAFGDVFGKAFQDSQWAAAFAARLATGLVSGGVAAVMRGGRVSVQSVAVDAFGNALGASLASASQPETQGFGSSSGMDYRNGMDIQNDALYAPGAGWAADTAARKQSADPLGLHAYVNDVSGVMRSAQSLWGSASSDMKSRALSDTSTNAELLENQMHHAGYDDGLMPAGGGNVRVTPGTVNGISVNQRVNNAFQAAGDLAGIGDMYRDYRLLGSLMGEVQQQATIDRLKGTLQGKLGMMRALPTPEAMGAVPGVGSDGVPRFNNADLIERYSDAVRKVELMKQGVIELDTRSMLITSIGTSKLSMAHWVAENTRRYGDAFAAGMNEGRRRYDAGKLYYPFDMPGQLQVGLFADDAARVAVIQYNRSIGVPEGPGQLLSMNRWSYDPSGSGAYNRIDLLMDLGPSRNNGAMILRTAIEGKASMAAVQSSSSQLQRVYDWVTPNVRTVTPQGVLPWTPQPKRLR